MFAEALEAILATDERLEGDPQVADVDRARDAGAARLITNERIAAELIDAILELGSRYPTGTLARRWHPCSPFSRFCSRSGSAR